MSSAYKKALEKKKTAKQSIFDNEVESSSSEEEKDNGNSSSSEIEDQKDVLTAKAKAAL